MKTCITVILYFFTACLTQRASAQAVFPKPFKTLTVADGLPQSFISGLQQDSTGFIWIGTRDGLARYDGRKFKVFRHVPGDSATLINNTITYLFLDKQNRLWIVYETGDVDVLNVTTEKLVHFTRLPFYKNVYGRIKLSHSLAEDDDGNIWMLSRDGRLFKCNLEKRFFQFYSEAALHLTNNKIVGFAAYKENIVLATDTALVTINKDGKIAQSIPYTFENPHLYNAAMPWKIANIFFRQNEAILFDVNRIVVYNIASKTFSVKPVKGYKMLVTDIVKNNNDDAFFTYGRDIYFLSASGKTNVWLGIDSTALGTESMLIDRSGVLWLGGNATGIHLYDLRLPRLSAQPYTTNFHVDVLRAYLHISGAEIKRTALDKISPYQFRWLRDGTGKMWFWKAANDLVKEPDIYAYANNRIAQPHWHYTDTVSTNHAELNAMAISPSGKLWGVDYYMHPVYLDTLHHTLTVYPTIDTVDFTFSYTANSIVMEGEDKFWITTSLNGLYFYNNTTGKKIHYAYSEAKGALPTNQLMNMVPDSFNPDILWIGSLGGGLIKFSKATGKCIFYTERNGLPNNTVYAVVADKRGILWCSCNKGIFSFNPQTAETRNYTSKDGLIGDEFNRYHFFGLPDGSITFGGVDGYTVFDPLALSKDNFHSPVALTGIQINNAPSDFGSEGSPLTQSINSVDKVVLNYQQNFLTFDFAALEYNITDKLQYRYRLEGFDNDWIYSGNNGQAVYTKLPPGHYTFRVNATNTAGEWSRYVKTLSIVIAPPFWLTWWFIALMAVVAGTLLYFVIQYRINNIKIKLRQKMQFRREASELRAQALRAQMNPHFVFNSLNSIKSLIQEDKKKEAVIYLTTFSKLIRAQLNNAEQEISLHDELGTCKLYAQLEALRFGDKVVCEFNIDESIDTHSLKVPPLLLQPFIENAIWHGILPRQSGKVTISVTGENGTVTCLIDDNGIGRELAMRAKSKTSSTYESKGMKLVKNRLNLFNIIHNGGGSVEVIDKKDAQENPAGTLVIIKFKKGT